MAIRLQVDIEEAPGEVKIDCMLFPLGVVTNREDRMAKCSMHCVVTYAAAEQDRMNRDKNKVGRISDEVMAEITRKVVMDKLLDAKEGKVELDITDEVDKMGGPEEKDMRVPSDPNDN